VFLTVKDIAPPVAVPTQGDARTAKVRQDSSRSNLEVRHASSAPSHDVEFRNPTDPLQPTGMAAVERAPMLLEPVPGPPELAPPPRPVSIGVPAPDRRRLIAALEAFLDGRTDEAIGRLRDFPAKDQEFLLRVMPLLAKVEREGLFAGPLTDEDRHNLLEALGGMTADLRASAPLVLHNLVFCRKVWGFGKYEPTPSSTFRAGDQIGLYLEVQNLAEHRLAEHQHAVQLACTLTILGPDGKPKHFVPVHSAPDISRSPRTDHFAVIRFRLPADLSAGLYSLHIDLRDELTGRKSEKAIRFRISTVATSP